MKRPTIENAPTDPGVPLVSVIMPVYNAAAYVRAAIDSVRSSTWANWELWVVDNGSDDGTGDLLNAITDPRVHVLHEPVRGVAHARNRGLAHMRGAFFCFLDADDILPEDSIRQRMKVMHHRTDIHFVDGVMEAFDTTTGAALWQRRTIHRGRPFDALMRMDGSAFLGNTWLIRRVPGHAYAFPDHMRHSEDIAFYLSIADQGLYDRTSEVTLRYRRGHVSAMSDLEEVHEGYRELYRHMTSRTNASPEQLSHAWRRMRRSITIDLLRRGRWTDALRHYCSAAPKSRS